MLQMSTLFVLRKFRDLQPVATISDGRRAMGRIESRAWATKSGSCRRWIMKLEAGALMDDSLNGGR